MQKFLIICFGLFIGLTFSADGQSRKEKKLDEYDRAATYEIKTTKKGTKKAKSKDDINKNFDEKIVEREKRMEVNAKRHKKISKDMKKPQYTDPTYFGHKKPPRKRPPGKKKFCKQCQMWH